MSPILKVVETIGAANTAMVIAAEQGKWDDFIAIAGARMNFIHEFKSLSQDPSLHSSPDLVKVREEILRLMSEHEALSEVINVRMQMIGKAIAALANTSKIDKHYRATEEL